MSNAFSFQEIEQYKLGEPSTFHYLNQSNCYSLSALDDAKEYLATRKAMDVVGISSEEQVLSGWSFYMISNEETSSYILLL